MRNKGFTLIELLVVIAIIALLVSILMPSLQQAKELALQAKCGVQLHNIGLAMNMYAEENDDWLPFGRYGFSMKEGAELVSPDWNTYDSDMNVVQGATQRLGLLYAKLWLEDADANYIDDKEMLYCPGRKRTMINPDVMCTYSYCNPGSGWSSGVSGSNDWRYDSHRREDWAYEPWWYNGYKHRKYVAWVACLRGHFEYPPESPHGNIGCNTLYRDNSAKFIRRPKGQWTGSAPSNPPIHTGWGGMYGATEFTNGHESAPFWDYVGMAFGV